MNRAAPKMNWATSRNLLANMAKGVSEGFKKVLEIEGVGFRAAVQGKDLVLQGRLQPRNSLPDPRRHRDQGGEANPAFRFRPRQPARGPDRRRNPANSRNPSRIRARAFVIPTRRSDAKKARRSKQRISWPLPAKISPHAARTASVHAFSAPRRPARSGARLSIHRSSKHIYAQVIDDVKGVTLTSASFARQRLEGKAEKPRQPRSRDGGRKITGRARGESRREAGRVRPFGLSLSRPRQGAGRRRPRRRIRILRITTGKKTWHVLKRTKKKSPAPAVIARKTRSSKSWWRLTASPRW